MKFVLWLDPDTDPEDHQGLLAFALASIRDNPELRWDILDDKGWVIAENVSGVGGSPSA